MVPVTQWGERATGYLLNHSFFHSASHPSQMLCQKSPTDHPHRRPTHELLLPAWH